MLSQAEARAIALSFPETTEAPHFEKTSFRVGKKIFATMGGAEQPVVVKLLPDQQAMMLDVRPDLYTRIAGTWGQSGWTEVHLGAADKDAFRHALDLSYRNVAPKKLIKQLDGG